MSLTAKEHRQARERREAQAAALAERTAPKPSPGSEVTPIDLYKTPKPAPAKPAKLTAAQQRSADRLSRLQTTYGETDGRTLHRLGLSEPQAATLFGTRVWTRLSKRDPAVALHAQDAANLLGLPQHVLTSVGGPQPDSVVPGYGGLNTGPHFLPGTIARFALFRGTDPEFAERIGLAKPR